MQFTRLRLSGFKSFVDPTELIIQPGLTGIVGPNGCGKSNLLEALRWVMGETSARLIRGSEMDDVIFAGTSNRPARNLAEVTLVLDNSDRRAPAAFNDTNDLEISRRIGRDAGSAYRINGKDVRARDVQTLFADASAGARSPALVGQGRIGMIINAKPAERRNILEEAAGIGGLHSRRHEAETRLKAAEGNLLRLDDAMGHLTTQLNSLKRQSRQASRYRNIQADIRKGEAMLLYLKWLDAEAALEAARADLAAAQRAVAEATESATSAITRENELADILPPLRDQESRAAQTLHRLIVQRDGLALEERRALETLDRLNTTLDTITRDLAREQALHSDAKAALARLAAERDSLTTAEDGADDLAAISDAQVEETAITLAEQEAVLDRTNRETAAIEARRHSLAQDIRGLVDRISRLDQAALQAGTETAALETEKRQADSLDDLALQVEDAIALFETVQGELEAIEAERADKIAEEQDARDALRLAENDSNTALRAVEQATRERVRQTETAANASLRAAETAAAERLRRAETAASDALRQASTTAAATLRDAEVTSAEALRRAEQASAETLRQAQQATGERLRQAETAAARLGAEEKALAGLLAADGESPWPPVIDLITVEKGFETALGAALGSDLDIAADPAAPIHWAGLGPLDPLPALPSGIDGLAGHVQAPPALDRVLSQIGVVATASDGQPLHRQLAPGQIIVSRAGDLWRWDGLTAAAEAPTAAAIRLAQRNRLKELTAARIEAEAELALTRDEVAAILAEAENQAETLVHEARASANARIAAARRAADRLNEETRLETAALVAEARDSGTLEIAEAQAIADASLDEVRAAADDAVAEVQARNEERLAAARSRFEAVRGTGQALNEREAQYRRQVRAANDAVNRARDAEAAAGRASAARDARLTVLADTLARTARDRAELEAAHETAELALADLPPADALETARARLTREVEILRVTLAQARAASDSQRREAEARRRRLGDITTELAAWERRALAAAEQLALLEDRAETAAIEREDLTGRPDSLREERDALNEQIAEAEITRKAAADALAAAENALNEARRATRQSESAAGGLRERRVRAEAMVEQADARRTELAAIITEELECKPSTILEKMEMDPGLEYPALADLEARLEKLKRERETIGPVNLRAEAEVAEIEAQFGGMAGERDDLVAAIAKLRGSIGSLNKEGRERLLTAFELVNGHFTRLFSRLFGGGRAHLALTESDDPLNAGLEIYASPPGKKMQVLSLLSGGEQTLTALSLIFAVFMVNPSPVCVLDEVDAPLDDANVVRFCDLCEDVTTETGTRFLVITHHGLTMQRMHRLFGVTMGEPGVSQLVSVDLSRAPELLVAAE